MPIFYVNKNEQNNGDHEVHTSTCSWLPEAENRFYLGVFATCKSAVAEAMKTYSQSNGCYYCSKDCHTS